MIKFKIGATVPVGQFANLMPEVETEAETLEEAEATLLPYIESFFNKWSDKVKIGAAKKIITPGRKLEKDLFGNEIFYDESKHEYTNSLGEVYQSGSEYADEDDFDSDYWATEYVINYGLADPADEVAFKKAKDQILEMWEVNSLASNSFGTAIHAAIQLFGQFHNLADIIDVDLKTGERKKLSAKIQKNSALSKLPYLKEAVNKFFTEERLVEKAKYEVLVVDHKNKRAGRIDRLLKFDDNTFAIRDLKTNYKILKKERVNYGKQLSFYADLMIANGAVLTTKNEPLMLHHWVDNDWKDIPLEKINTL